MIKYVPKEEIFMPKFFIKNNQLVDDEITILGEDVKHISNVLRMKVYDVIQVCDTDTSKNYNVAKNNTTISPTLLESKN